MINKYMGKYNIFCVCILNFFKTLIAVLLGWWEDRTVPISISVPYKAHTEHGVLAGQNSFASADPP